MSAPQPVDGEVFVTPRYLAGSSGDSGSGLIPLADWPHHHLDDGPHQLIVTSPDHRIRVGWAGDDYDLWTISAAPDAMSQAAWTAVANQNTPPELVTALTTALARDWHDGHDRFLNRPRDRLDGIAPLVAAGWTLAPVRRGVLSVTAPDGQAGADIDVVHAGTEAAVILWAGPKGWGTRAEITFSSQTPAHLVAATAQAFTDPAPAVRWRSNLHPCLAQHAVLTPVTPPKAPVPTPWDLRRQVGSRPSAAARSVPRWSTTTPSAPLPARPAARR